MVAVTWLSSSEARRRDEDRGPEGHAVHPALGTTLESWRATGWEQFVGRAPRPDDFILPRSDGSVQNGTTWNKWFHDDVARLGLREGRSVYAARATFISLAEGNGADTSKVKLLTHAPPADAHAMYQRLRQLWPALCQAVACIRLPSFTATEPAGLAPPNGEFAQGFAAAGDGTKNPGHVADVPGLQMVGAAGFEPATPAV